MYYKKLLAIMLIFCISIVSGCIDDGEENNVENLPTDYKLNLECENVGIHPETCVMDDEENPYRFVSVNEDNKWDLSSGYPKADFYLWATALNSTPVGENQFTVAEQLHKLYTLDGSETIRIQAIKAYRAVLDEFYWSTRFVEAWWIEDDELYYTEEVLRNSAGKRLVGTWKDYDNEAGMKSGNQMILSNLFETRFHALAEINKWGYVFDTENKVLFELQ